MENAAQGAKQSRQDREKKYWIRSGIHAIHIASGTRVFVDRLDIRRNTSKLDPSTQKPQVRVKGVVCSWVDANGVPHRKTFHTRELRPDENHGPKGA